MYYDKKLHNIIQYNIGIWLKCIKCDVKFRLILSMK